MSADVSDLRFEVRNANLYDPSEDSVYRGIDLAFANGELLDYGRNIREKINGGLYFDAEGRWVMPPLVDCHLHPAPTANPEYNNVSVDSILERYGPLSTGQIHANLRELFLSGVMAAREMGTDQSLISEYKSYREGNFPPRLNSCVQPITGVDGHISAVAVEIDDSTDCPSVISELKGRGATHIKVANDPIKIELELLERLVEIANDAGLPVACHAHSPEAIEIAIRAACDTVEHGFPPTKELAQIANSNDTVFVPTYYCALASILPESATNIPASQIGIFEEWKNNLEDCSKIALETDVEIAIGTDAGLPPVGFGDAWKEVRVLSEVGFSNDRLLRDATITGADVIGLREEWRLEKGDTAHLIILEDDPRETLDALRTATPVIFDGKPLLNVLDGMIDGSRRM